jgi:hypothetical protein
LANLCEWEVRTIVDYDIFHHENHIGCNFTLGGDGIRDFKKIKSEEERRKINESKNACIQV